MALANFRQMYGGGFLLSQLDESDGVTRPVPTNPELQAYADLLGFPIGVIQSMIAQQEDRL